MNPYSVAIDVIFIAIFVISILLGRRKGFVRMVLSLAALVASWIVAHKFSPVASQWLNDNIIREKAIALLTEKLATVFENGTREILEAIPEYINQAAELAGISIENLLTTAGEPSVLAENIFSACETTVVLPLLEFLTFILIFIVMNVVLTVIVRIADKIFDLPVLKKLNKTLGGAIGAIKGIGYVAIFGIGLDIAADYVFTNAEFVEAVNGSYIQKFISFLIDKV